MDVSTWRREVICRLNSLSRSRIEDGRGGCAPRAATRLRHRRAPGDADPLFDAFIGLIHEVVNCHVVASAAQGAFAWQKELKRWSKLPRN